MSNMGYCRFENTASDLADCLAHWDGQEECPECDGEGSIELPDGEKPGYKDCGNCGGIGRLSPELSASERQGKEKLIRLAQDLLDFEGYEVVNPTEQSKRQDEKGVEVSS